MKMRHIIGVIILPVARNMPFKRVWDGSFPLVYSSWEADGAKWTVQDLPPEDDEKAVEMMIDIFLPDEILCSTKGIPNDPAGIRAARKYWIGAVRDRTSLACYREKDGKKELVALNVCPIHCIDDPKEFAKSESEAWDAVIEALVYLDHQVDLFTILDVDKYLSGAGLLVRRDMRGARLGAKLLEAREPLCRAIGVKATVTLFTVPPSQKLAVRVGFKEMASISFAEGAAVGLKIPSDENIVMKLMAKRYDF